MYVYDDFLSPNCLLTSLKLPKCNKTVRKRKFNDLRKGLVAKVCYRVFYLVQLDKTKATFAACIRFTKSIY